MEKLNKILVEIDLLINNKYPDVKGLTKKIGDPCENDVKWIQAYAKLLPCEIDDLDEFQFIFQEEGGFSYHDKIAQKNVNIEVTEAYGYYEEILKFIPCYLQLYLKSFLQKRKIDTDICKLFLNFIDRHRKSLEEDHLFELIIHFLKNLWEVVINQTEVDEHGFLKYSEFSIGFMIAFYQYIPAKSWLFEFTQGDSDDDIVWCVNMYCGITMLFFPQDVYIGQKDFAKFILFYETHYTPSKIILNKFAYILDQMVDEKKINLYMRLLDTVTL